MVLKLRADNLSFGYGAARVLRDVTLPAIRSGEITALIGPNATGKSTLLKCLAGLHTPSGDIWIDDAGERRAAHTEQRHGRRLLPRRRNGHNLIQYVPQELPPPSSITVFEAVLLARQQQSHIRTSRKIVEEIGRTLALLHLDPLSAKPLSELSGGQRQMVSLAQALTRQPAFMLLDEPTSNLDLRNQLQMLTLIRKLATEQPAAIVITVHDLNLAARFADQAVVLQSGTVHSSGPPASVITTPMLRDVYQIDASIHQTPDGTPTLSVTRSL